MTLALTVPLADMEPVTSFVSRLAYRNLCKRASSLCADVGLSFSGIMRGDEDQIKMVADLGGVDFDTLLRYSVRKADRYKVRVGGEEFSKQTFQRSVLRVCPTCVQKGLDAAPWAPARHLSWKTASVHTCLVHQHRLIRLPDERFTADAQDFTRAIAGHLALIRSMAASPQVSVATEFERWIGDRLRHGAGKAWVDSLAMGTVMRTAETLDTLLRFGPDARFSTLGVERQQAAGQEGFAVLRAGKDALHTLLSGMVPPEHAKRKKYFKVYGGFYVWLTDQKSDGELAPITDIMRDVIVQNYPVRAGSTILGQTTGVQTKFSLHGVRDNFDIGPKRLRDELLARGLARRHPSSHDEVVIDRPLDRSLLTEINASILGHMNLQDAAKYLGLSEELFRKLVHEGVIPRRGYRQHRTHQYNPVFLDHFLDTIRQGAPVFDAVPEGSILALRAGQAVGARTSKVLHLIATRRVTCMGLLRGKPGLSAVIVDLFTLKNAAEASTISGLTYRETYQMLRVASPTLRYLLKQGFLTSFRGKNPTTLATTEIIPQVSLDAFLSEYITLGLLAHRCGRHANHLRVALELAEIHTVPLGLGAGAVYRRKQAEEALVRAKFLPG